MYDLDKLTSDLKLDEGYKPFLYDDDNGLAIRPGYRLVGHPTAGYGFALDVWPLSEAESAVILNIRSRGVAAQVVARLPWVSSLSEGRQRALINMAYNLGMDGLLSFISFLQKVKNDQFDQAAADLLTTKWAEEVGDRAKRIANLIREG